MKTWIYLSASILTIATAQNALAQSNPAYDAGNIRQKLERLPVYGSVLYVAAHPDDENTRLLAYLANEKKFRTGYVSLTRGDGGQNLIGKEQGEMLGLIRTQELLGARRIDGAEQFFTRAFDFGFSKNPEETFRFWNKDSVARDLVWIIRQFRPDVIITRFPTTGEGGHGHHTASAILAVDAFDQLNNPNSYPNAQLAPWQPQRLFWNTFNFGTTNTTSEDQLKLDVGIYNPVLGKNYGEIASESRTMHKSQGFGTNKVRGPVPEYFKQLKGTPAKNDIFEGIDMSYNRIPSGKLLEPYFQQAINEYDVKQPQKILKPLLAAKKITDSLKHTGKLNADEQYWITVKGKQLDELIVATAGLWIENTTSTESFVPGEQVKLQQEIIVRNNVPVKLTRMEWVKPTPVELKPANNWAGTAAVLFDSSLVLQPGVPFTRNSEVMLSRLVSEPYWLPRNPDEALFHWNAGYGYYGAPETAPMQYMTYDFEIAGQPYSVQRPVWFKSVDPVKGELYKPIQVLPEVTLNFAEKAYVAPPKSVSTVTMVIKANQNNFDGKLNVAAPAGWKVQPFNPEVHIAQKGGEQIVKLKLEAAAGAADGELKAWIEADGKRFDRSIYTVQYDHIPPQFFLDGAHARLVNLDVKTAGKNIAYIPGAGDNIPEALQQLGYNVTILDNGSLGSTDLSKFDAIITGIRAHNTNDKLQVYFDKLMQYVEKGGNLIVQYNTNNRIGPLVAKVGPYPFTISRDRVTDEKAAVTVLDPNHPAFNFPNKISQQDFEGWKQERGIYFATELDKNYKTLLRMNDPGEKPQEGSLIVAKYGKGNFVYTGLVFFRELPAGVPGAYRLFVNLLSLPKS